MVKFNLLLNLEDVDGFYEVLLNVYEGFDDEEI